MRISDWSSDVCSSDLRLDVDIQLRAESRQHPLAMVARRHRFNDARQAGRVETGQQYSGLYLCRSDWQPVFDRYGRADAPQHQRQPLTRSEEHTSELQSLMRISYAVFCLKKKKHNHTTNE